MTLIYVITITAFSFEYKKFFIFMVQIQNGGCFLHSDTLLAVYKYIYYNALWFFCFIIEIFTGSYS